MANASVCIHTNTITLKPVNKDGHVWIDIVDELGVLSNVSIFVEPAMWHKVEQACHAFNAEIAR